MFQSNLLHPINNPDFQIDQLIYSHNEYLQLEKQQFDHCDQDESLTVNGASSETNDAEASQIIRKTFLKGGNKRKRHRTIFKQDQLNEMKSVFQRNPNPDTAELQQLSQGLGLTKRVLQVWFQNARAKQRKFQPIKKSQSI